MNFSGHQPLWSKYDTAVSHAACKYEFRRTFRSPFSYLRFFHRVDYVQVLFLLYKFSTCRTRGIMQVLLLLLSADEPTSCKKTTAVHSTRSSAGTRGPWKRCTPPVFFGDINPHDRSFMTQGELGQREPERQNGIICCFCEFWTFFYSLFFAFVQGSGRVCVLFTLNCYCHPSASSTPIVRADASPWRATNSVVTNYETEIYIASKTKWTK